MSIMVDIAGLELDGEDRDILAHPLVTGFILFSRNYADRAQLAALTKSVRKARPDMLIAVDYEGGRVQRFRDGFTRLPPMLDVGRGDNAALVAHSVGQIIGAELAEFGIDVPFAPVVDLDGGISTVIGDRAFAANVADVVSLAEKFMSGLAAQGLASTLKHYPGHGQVAADSHLELPVDERPAADIRGNDMQAFAQLLPQAPSVMMAHVVYPEVDHRPASLSPVWIRDILRGELGYQAAVVCDDLNMAGADVAGDYRQRAVAAAEAGCDLLPVCNNRPAVVQVLDGGGLPHDREAPARLAALRRKPQELVRPTAAYAALDAFNAVNTKKELNRGMA